MVKKWVMVVNTGGGGQKTGRSGQKMGDVGGKQ